MTPTPEQQAVIDSTAANILVLAGAGSGKTQTLAWRLQRDLETCPASDMVVLTFTQAAARELRERLPALADAFVGTLHAYALEQIFKHYRALGYPVRPSIIEPEAEDQLLEDIKQTLSIKATRPEINDALATGASAATKAGLIAARFRQTLRQRGLVTFDGALRDLTALAQSQAYTSPTALYVDEYQDTSDADAAAYAAINPRYFFAVGDADQCVFEFRGANPRHIERLRIQPGTETLHLTLNRRSNSAIVAAANSLISYNPGHRLPMKAGRQASHNEGVRIHCYPTQREEVLSVTAAARLEVRERTVAILTRYNHEAQDFRQAAQAIGLPVATRKAPDPHRLLLRSALSALDNPDNYPAAERWLAHYLAARPWARTDATTPRSLILAAGAGRPDQQPAASLAAMQLPTDALYLFQALWAGSLRATIAAIDAGEDADRIEGHGVYIGTMHSAKGLEWETVFLPGWNQQTIPKSEERTTSERRLAYVAITRARTHLYLSHDAGVCRSQFLAEITA